MKSLELIPDHRNKLLEMCKVLFPKYKWQFCSEYGSLNSDTQVDALIQWKRTGKHSQFNVNSFHWFEFCMTHLLEKILNPTPNKPNRAIKEHFQEFFWFTNLYCNGQGGQHPIDYLYNEFKKLNYDNASDNTSKKII